MLSLARKSSRKRRRRRGPARKIRGPLRQKESRKEGKAERSPTPITEPSLRGWVGGPISSLHRYGTLLLVDTVVSLGAVPFFMDDWDVDAVYTSTQKALSGPAGISPVALSKRALAKIKGRKHEPPYYFDIKLLAEQWNCYDNTWAYHHTLSPPLIWALRQCLLEIVKETLPKSWARHAATTAHFHKRIQELPFKFLVPKPEDRLDTVTTIVLPKGYDYVEFSKYMRAKYNILIFPGLGPTAGKALRIGIMGVNSSIQVADAIADAMANTLRGMTKSSL